MNKIRHDINIRKLPSLTIYLGLEVIHWRNCWTSYWSGLGFDKYQDSELAEAVSEFNSAFSKHANLRTCPNLLPN